MDGKQHTSLRTKLTLAFAAVVVPVIAASGFFFYETARRSLDRELGLRLVAVAESAASRFNPLIISSFRSGDEEGRNHQSYRASLIEIVRRTGVKRLFVFGPDLASLLDSEERVRIGTPYSRLAFQRQEIEACKAGEQAASVLFRGEDGQWYKTGFAAIRDDAGRVVALLASDASASYLEVIAGLRRSVIAFVLAGMALAVGLAFLLARTVTRPVRQLVARAERIGRGNLDRPVELARAGTREIAYLASSLDRMRQRLNQREESQRLMVAWVAHEIRNPLGGIEMFASLARQEAVPGSPAAEYLDRVIREVASLKTIINHFLEFARPAPLQPEIAELAPIVAQATAMVRVQAEKAGAKFAIELPAGTPPVRVDTDQLSRVFLNLFQNALQAFEGPGGTIRVSAGRAAGGDEVAVRVEDNGCGMAQDTLANIFNPFFTTHEDGLGLGLAIVKKSLEENGGAVEVESTPGKGTRFTIYLPAADNRPG